MEILDKTTFPLAIINRGNEYFESNRKFALASRELLHNAKTAGATKVLMYCYEANRVKRLVIAHNGAQFEDIQNLASCMRMSASFNEHGGIQGSGMKAAMFLMTREASDAELVIHNRANGASFSAKLNCENANDGIIRDASEYFNIEIKNTFNDFCVVKYEHYNVFYTLKYDIVDGSFFDESSDKIAFVRMLAEMCPEVWDSLDIKFVADKASYNKDLLSALRPYGVKEFDNDYCSFSHTIHVNDVLYKTNDNDRGVKFDADVQVIHYPNIVTSERKRPVAVNKDSANYNISSNFNANSRESFYILCELDIETSKETSRMREDPIFSSPHAYDFLRSLGLNCPKSATFTAKLPEHYKEIYEKHNGNMLSWAPITKVKIHIYPKDKKEWYKYGGLNEFFYVDKIEILKEIRAKILDAIITNPNYKDELKGLQEKFRQFYPEDVMKILPLPKYGKEPSKRILCYKALPDGSKGKQLNMGNPIQPNTNDMQIIMEYEDGSPFERDFRVVPDRGISFEKVGRNTYLLNVRDLCYYDDAGNYRKETAETYKHQKNYYPKKLYYCMIDGMRYAFSFCINLPKREGNVKGRYNTAHGKDKQSRETTMDYYIEVDPSIVGKIKSHDNRLRLNNKNKFIVSVAQNEEFYEKYPEQKKEFESLYEYAQEKACALYDKITAKSKVIFKNEALDVIAAFEENGIDFVVNILLEDIYKNSDLYKKISKFEEGNNPEAEKAALSVVQKRKHVRKNKAVLMMLTLLL